MTMTDLLGCYRDYLDCLNDRAWERLGDFVSDDVVHNDRRLGLAGYRDMLIADTTVIPDLRFTPELLTSTGDVVACRLLFRCTPQREFLGCAPTGRLITFAEHVLYRYADARISEVWSLLDVDAVRRQLDPADQLRRE